MRLRGGGLSNSWMVPSLPWNCQIPMTMPMSMPNCNQTPFSSGYQCYPILMCTPQFSTQTPPTIIFTFPPQHIDSTSVTPATEALTSPTTLDVGVSPMTPATPTTSCSVCKSKIKRTVDGSTSYHKVCPPRRSRRLNFRSPLESYFVDKEVSPPVCDFGGDDVTKYSFLQEPNANQSRRHSAPPLLEYASNTVTQPPPRRHSAPPTVPNIYTAELCTDTGEDFNQVISNICPCNSNAQEEDHSNSQFQSPGSPAFKSTKVNSGVQPQPQTSFGSGRPDQFYSLGNVNDNVCPGMQPQETKAPSNQINMAHLLHQQFSNRSSQSFVSLAGDDENEDNEEESEEEVSCHQKSCASSAGSPHYINIGGSAVSGIDTSEREEQSNQALRLKEERERQFLNKLKQYQAARRIIVLNQFKKALTQSPQCRTTM